LDVRGRGAAVAKEKTGEEGKSWMKATASELMLEWGRRGEARAGDGFLGRGSQPLPTR